MSLFEKIIASALAGVLVVAASALVLLIRDIRRDMKD